MANFTINSNSYLRNLYSTDRTLATVGERAKVSTKDLGKADVKALKKGIESLTSYDYDTEDVDETKFYKTLKAFADSYNNTVKTGGDLGGEDSATKSAINDMKKLQSKYGDELEKYGISFDKKGYMSISSTAMDNIKSGSYKSLLGEDSEFLGDLSKIQKKLSRRINYLV